MDKQVAIIGGGVAGLAAATALAAQGVSVCVFEANQQLGGRARSITYRDQTLDNGQHILLGAYHETLRLLRLVGVDTALRFKRLPLELIVKDLLANNTFALKVPAYLPAPLHLLVGLLCAKGIALCDKWHAVRLMIWMKHTRFSLGQDESLGDFLTRKQQSSAIIQYLWEPLCLAALNTPIQTASAQTFLNVLKDSFSKQKQDADILLPALDLTRLLSEPLAHFITSRQGQVLTGTTIKHLVQHQGHFQLSSDRQTWSFSHVILACGPHQLGYLTINLPQISALPFRYEAITTVYLQYANHVRLPSAMIGSVHSVSQWIFDRGQITQQAGLIAVVISAHQPLKLSNDALSASISAELASLFPSIGSPKWCKVVTEKRATFASTANLVRPSHRTSYHNLYLAGDYTAGPYPATIEGAVRSGLQVAQLCRVS